ncbi:hypothetical protein GmHk_20G057379 [Glycine max]|nr:hypothetical protein GmHk_20G057379 [Glycine max]
MAHKLSSIKDINDSQETWKMAIRIINIWSRENTSRLILDMIFMDKDQGNFVIVRTIEKVLVANDWCYEGCPKCNRKCEEKLSPFICPGCQEENSSTVLRFRLGVKVSHQNDSLKFVLWNKESTLNQIVTDIKNQLIQEV